MAAVRLHRTVGAFGRAALPLLVEREAENNLMIGLLDTLSRDPHAYSSSSPVMLEVGRTEAVPAGLALMTPPYNLILTEMSTDNLEPLAEFVVEERIPVPGVLGPATTAKEFARIYSQRTGVKPRTKMEERIYQLDCVVPSALPAGSMRKAEPNDLPLLSRWGKDFAVDAGLTKHEVTQTPARMQRLIEREWLFVWESQGQKVSMAACQGPTPNGIRVGYVFTPRNLRRRGYATAVTANLSQHLLDQGRRFCFLFTDLSNPTSNSIYQKVGYEPVCDFHMIVWD